MTREYLEKMLKVCAGLGDTAAYYYYWLKLRELYPTALNEEFENSLK